MGGGAAAKKEDPRPINTAAFRQAAIRDIETFMIENEYSHPISAAKLTNPTARDFQTMVIFLLRALDPTFTFAGKVEDEMTLVAKALRYPFMPSKTALTTVGAPNTWPAILAMLLWLVELLRYDQSVRAMDADLPGSAGLDGDDEAAGTQEYFFWYIRKAYRLYLEGEDEQWARMDADIESIFEGQVAKVVGEVAAEEATLAQLEAELRDIQQSQSVLPRLRHEVRELETSIESMAKESIELSEYKHHLAVKHSEAIAEKDAATSALEKARAELDKVAQVVATQELSVEDVRRMAGTKSALRDNKERVAAARTSAAAEVDKLRLELRAKLDAVSLFLRGYQMGLKDATWLSRRRDAHPHFPPARHSFPPFFLLVFGSTLSPRSSALA
jgi:kinetochore protein NDC80